MLPRNSVHFKEFKEVDNKCLLSFSWLVIDISVLKTNQIHQYFCSALYLAKLQLLARISLIQIGNWSNDKQSALFYVLYRVMIITGGHPAKYCVPALILSSFRSFRSFFALERPKRHKSSFLLVSLAVLEL